jgi:hypothetical protein
LYELKRYSLAKDTPYDFTKHGSDWLDSQLLYYFADPVIHLVTCDLKIKDRTKDSTQSSRILRFDELLALARTARP